MITRLALAASVAALSAPAFAAGIEGKVEQQPLNLQIGRAHV